MIVTHTLVITVISGGREVGRRERERERGGEERLGRIDGGERWGGEMGERGGEERLGRIDGGREVGRRDGGERWGGERGREVGRRDGGERWEGERERERDGERGREVILLIKEVCEGQ